MFSIPLSFLWRMTGPDSGLWQMKEQKTDKTQYLISSCPLLVLYNNTTLYYTMLHSALCTPSYKLPITFPVIDTSKPCLLTTNYKYPLPVILMKLEMLPLASMFHPFPCSTEIHTTTTNIKAITEMKRQSSKIRYD